MADLLDAYNPHIDIAKLRPDGIISFLALRLDADYFDYAALGLWKASIGPAQYGSLNINGSASPPRQCTFTRSSGSWIDDGVVRGDVIAIYDSETSSQINNFTHGGLGRRTQVFDVTPTTLYCSDNNQAIITNTAETSATIRVQIRNGITKAVREHFRAIYDTGANGRARILTAATLSSILANETSFVSDQYDGKTYGLFYSGDRTEAFDENYLWDNGGALIIPSQSAFQVPSQGPSISWNTLLYDYFTASDPLRVASNVAAFLPADYIAVRLQCEYLRPRYHRLNVTSNSSGMPGGTFKIGFPYASTAKDEDVGFAFNDTTHTITRNDGGNWVNEGYEAGLFVRVNGGSTANGSATPKLIDSVSASVLTLDSDEDLNTATGDKSVAFDAIEKSGSIDASLPVRAFVGIGPTGDPVNGFTISGANTITRPETFSRTNDGFVEDGFIVGNTLIIENATDSANNGSYTITGVTNTTITVSGGLTNRAGDTSITLRREPYPQLRHAVKQALDAMTHVPECATMFWYDRGGTADARRILLLFFFDSNRAGGVWAYDPPYQGHVVGPDTVTGFDFINNTAPTKDVIVRNDGGSWLDDGFAPGGGLRVQNATNSANNGCYLIGSVTETNLTLQNRTFEKITQTGIQPDFPQSLTSSAGDQTATFRHTGYGVPTHATPEISAYPNLWIEQGGIVNGTLVTSAIVTGDGSVSLQTGTNETAYTNASNDCPTVELDWLDDEGNVLELHGKCVPRLSSMHGRAWLDAYFTAWFEEYRDLGGRTIEALIHDHEPKHPGGIDLLSLRVGMDGFYLGGAPTAEGLAASRNFKKYIITEPEWNTFATLLQSGFKFNVETSLDILTGSQLFQRQASRLIQVSTWYNAVKSKTLGFNDAIAKVFPDAVVFCPHTALLSEEIQFHSPVSFSGYFGTFGWVSGGQMESFFSLPNGGVMPDGDHQHDSPPPPESDNAASPFPVIVVKEIERNSSLVTTVRTWSESEVRANAKRGSSRGFADYFIGQYVRLTHESGSNLIPTFTTLPNSRDGNDLGGRWPIYRPILSISGDEITLQDYYFRDAADGVSLGVGGSNRIVRHDDKAWVNDGWAVGETIVVTNATIGAHNGSYTVTAIRVGNDSSIMTIAETPFGTSEANDTSVHVNKAAKSTLSPTVGDDFQFAAVNGSTNWDDFLYNFDYLRSTFKASRYPARILKNTYAYQQAAKYVAYGGALSTLVDEMTLEYKAEVVFHCRLYNVDNWIFTGASSPETHTEQVARMESLYGDAFNHLNDVCAYTRVKPFSLNAAKIPRKGSEYAVSGAILPNNRRLYRVTLKTDAPQDMTVPGATAQSTHTPGPVSQELNRVVFQTRFGDQFSVPGTSLASSEFNTYGWWTLTD